MGPDSVSKILRYRAFPFTREKAGKSLEPCHPERNIFLFSFLGNGYIVLAGLEITKYCNYRYLQRTGASFASLPVTLIR